MEQMIIDFYVKASELLLRNRLLPVQSWDTIADKHTDPTAFKFQLGFDHKFNFATKVPSEWNTHMNKLLVIEFFLAVKGKDARILVEQWIFDMNQVSEQKLEHTIDSTSSLHKKLSVLLRTISTLSVTLPLYQKYVKDRSGKLAQQFTLEHSISFTRHSVSNWHPSLHEEKDFMDFTSPDFVLPGRTFTFKVNFSKSLKIVQNLPEILLAQENEKQQLVQVRKASNATQFSSQASLEELNLIRRAFSDNPESKEKKYVPSSIFTDSPPEVNPWGNNSPSAIAQTIQTMEQAGLMALNQGGNSPCSRKSSEPRIYDATKMLGGPMRTRIQTLDSESFGEIDIFICDTDDGKFTEVLSWKEIHMRSKSPTRANAENRSWKRKSDHQLLRKFSEELEKSKLRLSLNLKPIEKVIEQSDDDKIAELLLCIEDLKSLSNEKSQRRNSGGIPLEKSEMEERKGLKFENRPGNEGNVEEAKSPLREWEELQSLYSEMKLMEVQNKGQ